MKSHLFQEVQRVRQPWIYVLVLVVFGIWMWQLIQQVILGEPFGQNPASNEIILLIGIIPLATIVLLAVIKLETRVYKDLFQYRMWPFHRNFRNIKPDEVFRWEVKKYNPIAEYGGWGIRQGWGKKGMAINISGNMGAYFELRTGKKILIGTRRPEELRSALGKMMAAVTLA